MRATAGKKAGAGANGLFAEERHSASPVVEVLSSGAPRRSQPSAARVGPYTAFYKALGELRETFHRIGRFDDANAKLEELCKLLVLAVLDRRHPLPDGGSRFSHDSLAVLAAKKFGSRSRLAAALHQVHGELATRFPEELTSFAGRSGLALAEDDDEFAAALVPLLSSLPAEEPDATWSFDGVNEAFGHFIQDSFRNRKEDAQYMTPPEVVAPAITMALGDLMRDLSDCIGSKRPVRIADPTCGVGSFLAAAYRIGCGIETRVGRLADHMELLGQDKVDRMVRLANVNLRVFARTTATIRTGNSILPATSLDDWKETIDLIVTNPPFGAEFSADRILAESKPDQMSVMHHLARTRRLPPVLGSEYILLDRELSLLRPGGRLLMVVPDHVVSGTGFPEEFRAAMLHNASLEAVFDLPTETFAQAGTRTKTSVVYLRRHAEADRGDRKRFVFMAVAADLGFKVKSRTGATVKEIVGHNDMETVADHFRAFRESHTPSADIACISTNPSIAVISSTELLGNRWNAGFYRSERIAALQSLGNGDKVEIAAKPLGEIVQVDPKGCTRATPQEGFTCISVLHVREDGSVDVQAAREYRPTTPCVSCQPGDILLSRINPRIMRICVVPNIGTRLACSAEFAILRPFRESGLSASAIALLLRADLVQSQIRTLTSGTSSSHNRVKPRDLMEVRVPVPARGSTAAQALDTAAIKYTAAMKSLYSAYADLNECDQTVRGILTDPA